MKKILFAVLFLATLVQADVKISQLPLGSGSSTGINDSFPYVNATSGTTERLKLSDLINVPALATPNFSGGVVAPTITLSSGANTGYCWIATNALGAGSWQPCSSGSGTVTSFSFVTANGFTGSVANPNITPSLMLGTNLNGLIKGNGTAFSAASSGSDYSLGTASLATGILKSTTGTGGLSIATAPDFPTLNQSTTGSAGSLTQALTMGLPIIGNSSGVTTGTKSGSTTDFATTTGSLTNGDCVKIDASGNFVDSGGSCGGSGGTPGGASTNVQFNSSGAFAGNASFTYNGSGAISLGTNASVTGQVLLDNGGTSGAAVTVQNNAATTAFNFNLPATAGSANAPLLSGGGGSTAMAWGSRSGNTTTFGTTSGSLTTGDCIKIDASGNLIDSGSACNASSLTFADSLVNTAGTVTLVNDSVSPAINSYYGTNGSGTLGYFTIPSGFSNPMTTLGDSMYEDATPVAARLAGNTSTTKKYLSQTGTGSVSAPPVWSQPAFSELSGQANLASQVSGQLPPANGGTGLSSITAHDLIIGNGTGNATLLAPSATSGVPLVSQGSSSDPTYGTVTVAGGGLGITSGTSGGVPYFSSSSTIASSAALTANQLVIGGGAGAAPAALGSLGTTTTVLHGNASGAPTYGAVSLTTDVNGTLPAGNGGTGQTSIASAFISFYESVATTIGDIIYGGASGAPTRLAGNTTSAVQVLTSQGTGSVATAPSWQSISAIGISTDTVEYVPTITGMGTVASTHVFYRRSGDRLLVQGQLVGGVASGTTWSMTLPTGLLIDYAKISSATTSKVGDLINEVNTATYASTSTGPFQLFVDGSTNNFIYLAVGATGALTKAPGNGPFGNSATITFNFDVPIASWSSNTIGTGQGAVYMQAKGQPTGGASSGAIIVFPTTVSDTSSAYNNSTGEYAAPVSGAYLVCACNNYTTAQDIFVFVNGVQDQILKNNDSTSFVLGCTLVTASAGQNIDIRPVGGGISTTGPFSSYSIQLISGNAGSGPGAPVTSRYYNSATSISGSLATINWTTQDYDNTAMCSGGTCTIPANDAGKYSVCTALTTAGTIALNSVLDIQIQKNGTAVSEQKLYAGGAMTDLNGGLCDTLNLIAGDTIRVQASSTATLPSITSSNTQNYMTVIKVSN